MMMIMKIMMMFVAQLSISFWRFVEICKGSNRERERREKKVYIYIEGERKKERYIDRKIEGGR